jgi:hypothetical protein
MYISDSFLAMSTDVEQAFSKGGLTVSKFCCSLADQSIWSATMLGSWVAKGRVEVGPLVEHFKEKSLRPHKKARIDTIEVD